MCWRWDWTLPRAVLGYLGPDHPAVVTGTFPLPPSTWWPLGHIQAKAARTGSPYGTPTRSCLLISWLFRTYDTIYSTCPTPKRKPSCIDQAALDCHQPYGSTSQPHTVAWTIRQPYHQRSRPTCSVLGWTHGGSEKGSDMLQRLFHPLYPGSQMTRSIRVHGSKS